MKRLCQTKDDSYQVMSHCELLSKSTLPELTGWSLTCPSFGSEMKSLILLLMGRIFREIIFSNARNKAQQTEL